jgi:hypothetical protein
MLVPAEFPPLRKGPELTLPAENVDDLAVLS